MTGNVKVTEGWLSSLNSIKFNHSLHYRQLCVGKLMNSLFATCSRAVRTQTKIVLIVFGSFLKQLLPQIIHFHGIFLINQPIWGCPHDRQTPKHPSYCYVPLYTIHLGYPPWQETRISSDQHMGNHSGGMIGEWWEQMGSWENYVKTNMPS